MKFFYSLICSIYSYFFTFCEHIFLKNKKIQNNNLFYKFGNVKFQTINANSFEIVKKINILKELFFLKKKYTV